MKIITWNCQGAFRKKAEYILIHKPDILIVPECEHPSKLKFKDGIKKPTDIVWFGDNPHKGLGVFSYGKSRFQLLDVHNADFKNILPISITGGKIDFTLLAVWANNPKDPDGWYVTQVWKAIHHYDQLLQSPVILAGDFNSNTIWDKPWREGNHTTVVDRLVKKEIFSAYHQYYKQAQGKEEHPTFYLHRNERKPYHLDFCFASSDLMDKMKKVEIGKFKDWISYSDHTPLSVTFRP